MKKNWCYPKYLYIYNTYYNDLNPGTSTTICYQCKVKSTQDHLEQTSHTLKYLLIHSTKNKEASRWIFTHL